MNHYFFKYLTDAIKADSKFQDVQDVNIEKAIKSWLGQAPFRVKNVIQNNIETIEHQ